MAEVRQDLVAWLAQEVQSARQGLLASRERWDAVVVKVRKAPRDPKDLKVHQARVHQAVLGGWARGALLGKQ